MVDVGDFDEDVLEELEDEDELDESELSFFVLDESDDLVSLLSFDSDSEDDPSCPPLGLRA